MMKEPAFIEKISCGLTMQETVYKVFKELTFETIQRMKNKNLQDYLFEFRETSDTLARTLTTSGMKKFKSKIQSRLSPEVEAFMSKETSCSPYFGGNSHARLELRIDGGVKQKMREIVQ